jgi:ABC-type transport system involved in Fe-S cluster assembly fused permease/ATPase subunit
VREQVIEMFKGTAIHLGGGPASIPTRSAKSTTVLTEQLQDALEQLIHGRPIIAVADCLSTVAGFERPLVRTKGKIMVDGPPNMLRVQRSVYAWLWDVHARVG